jgi:hypothetical protein
MSVRFARGVVDLPARYVDGGYVGLTYAMTVNKAHGTTCDTTMTLADDLRYRELAYEAMSRGRHHNHIYISRSTLADLEPVEAVRQLWAAGDRDGAAARVPIEIGHGTNLSCSAQTDGRRSRRRADTCGAERLSAWLRRSHNSRSPAADLCIDDPLSSWHES